MRPGRGGTDPGPRNIPIEMQNPDIFVPPATDHGTVANLKFPFSASHMRLERGGWTQTLQRTSCAGRRRDSCCPTSRRAHHCRFVCSLNEQIFGMIEQGRSRGQSD